MWGGRPKNNKQKNSTAILLVDRVGCICCLLIFVFWEMMTMRVLFTFALALASADAATRVAVIELGKAGTVRRTTASNVATSPQGVASFWGALHGHSRKLQHAGMTVVPDMFSRPDSGVVVGLTGVDLDNMPMLNGLMTEEGNGVVGHMEMHGQRCNDMMRSVNNVQEVQASNLYTSFQSQAAEAGMSGMKLQVSSENAHDIDMQLGNLVQKAAEDANNSGKTVVLHLVVEEDDGASRRRRLARRLQDGEGEGEAADAGENADAGADNESDQFNGFYGYKYYNAYGELVTPYKTMFQIQYFNVVLWTSLGLLGTLAFSLYTFMYMPLMADTLLFGESAKVVHDD